MPEGAILRPIGSPVYAELEREGFIERQGGGWVITREGRTLLTSGEWLY